jgi:hypothetical protein
VRGADSGAAWVVLAGPASLLLTEVLEHRSPSRLVVASRCWFSGRDAAYIKLEAHRTFGDRRFLGKGRLRLTRLPLRLAAWSRPAIRSLLKGGACGSDALVRPKLGMAFAAWQNLRLVSSSDSVLPYSALQELSVLLFLSY